VNDATDLFDELQREHFLPGLERVDDSSRLRIRQADFYTRLKQDPERLAKRKASQNEARRRRREAARA
jgi:hypothetical protein